MGPDPKRPVSSWSRRLSEVSRRAPSSIGEGEHGCSKRSFRPVIDYEDAPRADSDLDASSADLGGDFVVGLADTPPLLAEGDGQTGPFEAASFDEEAALALERDGIRNRISQIIELVAPGHDGGLPRRGASRRSRPGQGGLGTAVKGRLRVAWHSHVRIPVGSLEPPGLASVETLGSVDHETRPSPDSDEEAVDAHRRRRSLLPAPPSRRPPVGAGPSGPIRDCGGNGRVLPSPRRAPKREPPVLPAEYAHGGQSKALSMRPVWVRPSHGTNPTRSAFRSVDAGVAAL